MVHGKKGSPLRFGWQRASCFTQPVTVVGANTQASASAGNRANESRKAWFLSSLFCLAPERGQRLKANKIKLVADINYLVFYVIPLESFLQPYGTGSQPDRHLFRLK